MSATTWQRVQVDQLELDRRAWCRNLQRISYRRGDIVPGCRYYARPRDLRPVIDAGADFIVRTGWNSLRFVQANGEPFDLFAALAAQAEQESEVQVRIHEGMTGAPPPEAADPAASLSDAKDPEQAEAEQKRLLKDAKKRAKQPDPRSTRGGEVHSSPYLAAGRRLPAGDILALYRFAGKLSWRSKGFKSLAGLDMLPAKKPELARAWIYAKADRRHHRRTDCRASPGLFPSGPGKTTRKPNRVGV